MPERVIYSYKTYSPLFQTLGENVELVQGQHYVLDKSIPTLLIIDDQFADKNDQLIDLSCVNSHYKNTSVILVSQSLYFDNKAYRTACKNAMYTILFKSPRDNRAISRIAHDMFDSTKAKGMIQAYNNATQKPYGYLIIDMKPDTPECLRLRTNVLGQEGEMFQGVHLMHCYMV